MKLGGCFKKYHNSVRSPHPTTNPNFEAKKNWTMRNLLLDFDLPHVAADSLNGMESGWLSKTWSKPHVQFVKMRSFERAPNLLLIF